MCSVALTVIIERIVENIKMEKEQIVVSVLCLAYNHEKYIRKCLDGFIMQKANFAFEVLINDDASTDGTAKIIREYEEKYPDIIKPTYQTENQHSQGIKINQTILFPKAKGKYIAFCEGDDYWVDPYKLQKQVDVLENNLDCYFCVHRVEGIYENGSLTGGFAPSYELNEGVIISNKFMELIIYYSFQTSCYMARAQALGEYYAENPKFKQVADVGDEPMLLYFGYLGNIYFINNIMSRYRKHSISSWSLNYFAKPKNAIRHYQSLRKMVKEFDKYSSFKFTNICRKRLKVIRRDLFHSRMRYFFPNIYPKLLKWYRVKIKKAKN